MVNTYADTKIESYRPAARASKESVLEGLKAEDGFTMDQFFDAISGYCHSKGIGMKQLYNGSLIAPDCFKGPRCTEGYTFNTENGREYKLLFLQEIREIDESRGIDNENGLILNTDLGKIVTINSNQKIFIPSKSFNIPEEIITSHQSLHYLDSDPLAKAIYQRLSR